MTNERAEEKLQVRLDIVRQQLENGSLVIGRTTERSADGTRPVLLSRNRSGGDDGG
jgi:hypothetical protein